MPIGNHAPGAGSNKVDTDIVSRVSYLSGAAAKDIEEGGYTSSKTPTGNEGGEFEGGALRAGGRPILTSRDNIGLFVQYAVVGLIYGSLPETIYPFMQEYLNSTGSQVTAASTLVVLPWSFKVFYGILSDCFPIFGYRRRPYMLIGWGICFIMLVVMACSPVGKPYFTDPADRDVDPSDYTPEIKARINYNAPSEGAKYVMLMFFAAFGYVMSDVCADAIMAGLAQREPVEVRGKTQTMIYTVRTVFVMIGEIITGFCFNGADYGGSFDFSLSFPQLMIIFAVCTVPVFPSTWFFIKEDKQERVDFKFYITQLYEAMCKRAVYQVIAFVFLYNLLGGISYTASSPVQEYMVGVTPINSTISDILSNLLFMFGLMVTSKWGLGWNWHWMIVATGLFVIAIDFAVSMITVWDVLRDQWFWLGPPIAVQLPAGVGWMIANFVIVEIIEEGSEGAMYGLVTTVGNVASPFANTFTLLIDRPFNLTTERIQEDDHSIRKDLTYAIIIAYAFTMASWFALVLLPNQKQGCQKLLRKGGRSRLLGMFTVFYLSFAIVWSVMVNIMAIFASTACLVIAGGNGC